MRIRPLSAVCVAAALFAAFASCASFESRHTAWRLDLDPDYRPGVVLLFVDGLDREILNELLAERRLPNIQRYLVEDGVRIEAVSCLPTITYLNTASLLTGAWAHRHGIYGNYWFDRERLEWRDYRTPATFQAVNTDVAVPTVYEYLHGLPTLNMQCHTRRGVSATFDNPIMSALDWMFGNYEGVDARVGRETVLDRRLLGPPDTRPVLATLYFPGVDEVAHQAGPRSARYAAAIRNVDAQLGRVVESLESQNLLNQTYILLVTDHGQYDGPVTEALSLTRWLRTARGLRAADGLPLEPAAVSRMLAETDVLVLPGTARHAVFHVRGPGGWSAAPAADQVEALLGLDRPDGLLSEPAVGLICHRVGDDAVRVISRSGVGQLERRPGAAPAHAEYRLVAPAGADPLGYLEAGLADFVGRGWSDSRAWLAATLHSDYPDFVPQIVEFFRSPRAGDVLVFASDGAWFTPAPHPGHGGVHAGESRVSLLLRGPGLPRRATLYGARLIDVVPTLLDLLALSERLADATLDGLSLAAQLRAAGVEVGHAAP